MTTETILKHNRECFVHAWHNYKALYRLGLFNGDAEKKAFVRDFKELLHSAYFKPDSLSYFLVAIYNSNRDVNGEKTVLASRLEEFLVAAVAGNCITSCIELGTIAEKAYNYYFPFDRLSPLIPPHHF